MGRNMAKNEDKKTKGNKVKLKVAPTHQKEAKKNTSLRLEPKVLKALKIRVIQEDTSLQAVLEQLIEGYLEGRFVVDKEK